MLVFSSHLPVIVYGLFSYLEILVKPHRHWWRWKGPQNPPNPGRKRIKNNSKCKDNSIEMNLHCHHLQVSDKNSYISTIYSTSFRRGRFLFRWHTQTFSSWLASQVRTLSTPSWVCLCSAYLIIINNHHCHHHRHRGLFVIVISIMIAYHSTSLAALENISWSSMTTCWICWGSLVNRRWRELRAITHLVILAFVVWF